MRCLFGGLLACLVAGHVKADVLFTSYVGSDIGGYTTTSDYEGIQFTATASGTLFQVIVSPFALDATSPVTWPLALYTDSGGEPGGTPLETWNVSVTGSGTTPITEASVVHPTITAGTVYWLVIQNTTPASIADMGWEGYSGDIGGYWDGATDTLTSMTNYYPTDGLIGAELDTAPEPGSIAFIGAGCLFLLAMRMHKARVR